MEFGERITMLRKEKKLIRDEVADYLGISMSAYREYERGNVKPQIDKLVQLSKLFNVSTDFMLGLSDEETHINKLVNQLIDKIKKEVKEELRQESQK